MEGDFKNVIAQSLECPVCLNIFSEPKLLSCAHTFCNFCLERLMECHDDDKLLCPVCREPTQVTDVSKLQTNLALKSLVDDVKNHYQCCTRCKSKEKPQAVVYCQECGEYLCTSCQTVHSQWEKDHEVLAIRDMEAKKIPVKRYRKCKKHPKEDEECFCSECRIFVCFRCGVMEHAHKGHQIIDASAFEKDLTKSVKELKSKADKKHTFHKKYIDFIDEQKERVSNVRNRCIEDIKKVYEELVRQLTEKKDLLLREVETKTDVVDAELDRMKETAQHQINHVTTMIGLLASGKKIPLEMDALAAHDTLCQELEETLNQDDRDYKEVITSSKKGKRIAFERNLGTDELGLGKIVDSVGKDIALPSKDSMSVMASTPDGRMAVGCITGGIEIFSADGQLQQTVLKNVSIYGVGFLSDNRYVVLDSNNNITLYTTVCEKQNVKFEALSEDEGGYGDLTVDSDDQIYVSYREAKKIHVFSPAGGKALKEIPCYGYEPEQITISNDVLIISYGNTVVNIDQEGKVKHKATKPDFYPRPCVTQDNSILIAWVNHNEGLVSIEEYTTELTHIKTLISDYKIEKPEKRNWYYLGEFRSGEIAFCTADRLYIFN